jgi:hypothetical protein
MRRNTQVPRNPQKFRIILVPRKALNPLRRTSSNFRPHKPPP